MIVHKSAEISACGKYRYRLDRWWDSGLGKLAILMLNPSTADAEQDDATIRKCIGFAQRWHFYGITVVNLYALRARDPLELVRARAAGIDIVGPENLSWIEAVSRDCEGVLCAWGCDSATRRLGPAHVAHADLCARILSAHDEDGQQQIGPATRTGSPRHPLMPPYSSPRIPYEVTR